MLFKIIYRVYSHGDYDTVVPETPPLPGAVLVETWVRDMYMRDIFYYKDPEAYINANGKPVIRYVEKSQERFNYKPFKSFADFKKIGRNHQLLDDRYVREIPEQYWQIEIGTLEQLVALLREYDFELELSGNDLALRMER